MFRKSIQILSGFKKIISFRYHCYLSPTFILSRGHGLRIDVLNVLKDRWTLSNCSTQIDTCRYRSKTLIP